MAEYKKRSQWNPWHFWGQKKDIFIFEGDLELTQCGELLELPQTQNNIYMLLGFVRLRQI